MIKHLKYFILKIRGLFEAVLFYFRLKICFSPISFLYAFIKKTQNMVFVILSLSFIAYFSIVEEWKSLSLGVVGLCLMFYGLYRLVRLDGELLPPSHEYNTIKEDIINKIKPGVDSSIVNLSRGSVYHNQKFNSWLMNNADWKALIKTSFFRNTPRRQTAMKRIGELSISTIGLLMKPVMSKNKFYNASLLSLQSDPFDGFSQEHSPTLEPTSYFEFYLTNRLSCQIYRPAKHQDKDVSFLGMYPVSEDRLLALGSQANTTANVIGVNTVVITNDQMLLSWFQGETNLSSAGLITPTGSGSCDWSDLKKVKQIYLTETLGFKDILKKGMLRELREETKCCSGAEKGCKQLHKRIDIAAENFKNTMILGAYRWLENGAKPDFVGITRLDFEGVNRQLCPDDDEVVFSFKTTKVLKEPLDIHIGHIRSATDIPHVVTAIEEHVGKYEAQLSVPMAYTYKQIVHYLKEAHLMLSKGQNLPPHLQTFMSILDPEFHLKSG